MQILGKEAASQKQHMEWGKNLNRTMKWETKMSDCVDLDLQDSHVQSVQQSRIHK